MKKIFLFLVATILLVFLYGCNEYNSNPTIKKSEMRAIWISYYEYDIKGLNYNDFKARINEMFDNIKGVGLNTVIVHTRVNADSIYKSEYFPYSDIIKDENGQAPDYDPLEYMVNAAHERNLSIHAWINPFRVSNKSSDITTLCENHIARQWYESEETKNNVIPFNEKIYFNPASADVRKLIINGVREIINRYEVDGIHIDDYFYPTTDENFDKSSYSKYLENCSSPLSLTEWRITNINTLISEIWKITNSKEIMLGISPSAHIDEEYFLKNGYANTKEWLKSVGFADYITPQIYWGFDYSDKEYRFDVMLKKWVDLKRDKDVMLIPGLAAYKIGTEDTNDEWINNSDILKRQVMLLREQKCDGFALFSYSYLFSNNQQNALERQNLSEIL